MLIYDKELVKNLEPIGLPVHYNQILDSTITLPVITYEPANNYDYLRGFNESSTLYYSKIDYYIRVWGKNKRDIIPYMEQVDEIMMTLGFKRSSYTELPTDTGVCLVGLYKAIGFEHY